MQTLKINKIKFRYGIYVEIVDDYGYFAMDRSFKKRAHDINVPSKLCKFLQKIMKNHRKHEITFTVASVWHKGQKFSTVSVMSPKDQFVKAVGRATTKHTLQIIIEIYERFGDLAMEEIALNAFKSMEWVSIEKPQTDGKSDS